mmetsp:Transcript_47561/g.146493  ORF Transcript_47561/g.146493 Transcript_47561/m.146493 type:complete len:553 (+) Transcript_47561:74-1732(+)
MSAKAWQMQQDVNSILRKIEGDIHEFKGSLKRAEAIVNREDQRRCRAELETISGRLQDRRAEIRRWSVQLDAKAKGRLGAARAHIEQELRRFKAFEARLPAKEEEAAEAEAEAAKPDAEKPEANFGSFKVLVEQIIQDSPEKTDMTEEFVCKICMVHVVSCKPKLTSCSHLFCGDCLDKWFEVQPGSQSWARRAGSSGAVPCPVCKENLHMERNVFAVGPGGRGGSDLLWKMLSAVPLACANSPECRAGGRCDWKGVYGEYQEHISQCKNVPSFSASTTTSPTATPDFSATASCIDDMERLRLDSAGSEEESYASEVEELHPAGGLSPSPKAPEEAQPQQDVQEEAEPADRTASDQAESPAAPTSSLASLIGALVQLKVQERMEMLQATGEGTAPASPLRSSRASIVPPPGLDLEEDLEEDAAPLEEPAAEAASVKEFVAGIGGEVEMSAVEPTPELPLCDDAPKTESTAEAPQLAQVGLKMKQAANSATAARRATMQAQWQMASAARMAQYEAAQWQAAQWQMAQAAQWQHWQEAQWEAAQWYASQPDSSD